MPSALPRIRVVYRSYGGDNDKDRPPFYSKMLALRSLLRAADAVGCEIIFLNDGPVSDEIAGLMRGRGEIVMLPGVGLFPSLMAALRLPLDRGWADDDLVYFCEDDYLHTADALVRLQQAAATLPAEYLALYATLPGERAVRGVGDPTHREPRDWKPVTTQVGDQSWERVLGTTSTFGVRVHALRKDMSIVRQAKFPHKNMYRDWDVSLAYQGYRPYRWADLGRDLTMRISGSLTGRLRTVVLVPFKVAMNLRSWRRPANRHLLMAASPNLATHLESVNMASGRNWDDIAADTRAWADAPGPRSTDVEGVGHRTNAPVGGSGSQHPLGEAARSPEAAQPLGGVSPRLHEASIERSEGAR